MKDKILARAMELAEHTHYARLTRQQVASATGCGAGTINFYFGDMKGLRDAIVAEAVSKGDPSRIVAQAYLDGHRETAALNATEALRGL